MELTREQEIAALLADNKAFFTNIDALNTRINQLKDRKVEQFNNINENNKRLRELGELQRAELWTIES